MKLQGQRQTNNYEKVPELTAAQASSFKQGSKVPVPQPKNPLDRAVKGMAENYKQTENEKALMPGITKAMEGAAARDRIKTKMEQRTRWEGADRKMNKEENAKIDKTIKNIQKTGRTNPFAKARG
jgi:hypothetical protein